ncbi:pimeloyl-[acyl-carrier protein] methyl ester esterase [Colwellia sp. MT41]|uniref:Pimeloyl-[acyl-carrier protein] methyl ester esterase n=1 Tax=Colwellia marinimaniae TaxID=1513592 RepID=A0ABQ0MRT5_9GAMM|nr:MULTISPECIES: pimeloyl-ACP methyl ester esterase BioH [Colwellia]ALO33442.1 pimeloyl-[acyl-carrier protein] methyl ester esterase [Colwellia sp. MT41]GAW95063.1 Pimeloyl-[acyl-carrier protein] methyl ester esterase [Colwellia marinimaniae]
MAKSLTFSTFPPQSSLNNNAIPIVLIHGWGLNSGVWQPLLKLFSENKNSHYQLITLDLPGFGINSAVAIKPYSLANICHHIEQVIDQPAIYLGWSLGGLIATQMSINYPEKVLALITVASSPYFVEQEQNNWPGIKANVLDSFHHQLAQDTEKTIKAFLKIQAMGSPHIRQDLKLISKLVMAHALPSQETLANSLALLSDCDLRQQLASIQQPFLRLYGQNDSLVPKTVIEKISLLAVHSDLHVFDHASHAPFISHLDDFYQVLCTWLALHFNANKAK